MPRLVNRPKWIKQVKVGDVLKSRSGLLRVVRYVNHHAGGCRTWVSFTINHCSWTGRCYTMYEGNDLIQFGYRPVRVRMKLRKKIDKAILREIVDVRGGKPTLTCCDVEGIG